MPDKDQILIADDMDTFLRLEKMLLEHAGYDIIMAKNGTEALKKIQKEKPRLVFLDLAKSKRKWRWSINTTPMPCFNSASIILSFIQGKAFVFSFNGVRKKGISGKDFRNCLGVSS